MSFSFSVVAASKGEAKANVAEQMATVIAAQSIHAKDEAHVKATVESSLDLIADDETRDVSVYVVGSLSWEGQLGSETIVGSSISVNSNLKGRVA